jgi:hypothetical protein
VLAASGAIRCHRARKMAKAIGRLIPQAEGRTAVRAAARFTMSLSGP